jgi:hypothetical protein
VRFVGCVVGRAFRGVGSFFRGATRTRTDPVSIRKLIVGNDKNKNRPRFYLFLSLTG